MEQELWDEGLYGLKIESVDLMHDAMDDDTVYVIDLRHFDGRGCVAYAANNDRNKEVFWGAISDDFYKLPEMVGRSYIFPIRIVQIGDLRINTVGAPVQELVS